MADHTLRARRLGIDTRHAAVIYVVTGDLLAPGEAGLSEAAWARLGAVEAEDAATVRLTA
jgi:hypothetical protein